MVSGCEGFRICRSSLSFLNLGWHEADTDVKIGSVLVGRAAFQLGSNQYPSKLKLLNLWLRGGKGLAPTLLGTSGKWLNNKREALRFWQRKSKCLRFYKLEMKYWAAKFCKPLISVNWFCWERQDYKARKDIMVSYKSRTVILHGHDPDDKIRLWFEFVEIERQ